MYKILLTLILALIFTLQAHALEFKIATLSPDGSAWMKLFREAAEQLETETEGRVSIKFFPGGIMGNDDTVMRKIRVGQLHGGAVVAGSLMNIYQDLSVYGIPFLFKSLEEVDHVRAKLDTVLLTELEKNGFVSFGFAEGGFAYLMSQEPITRFSDLYDNKVWVPNTENITSSVAEKIGISPIPLGYGDVLTGLQTGLIDTIASAPVATIALQWHTGIDYLTELPLAYISGLMVVDKKHFDRLSAADQATMRRILGDAFNKLNAQNRTDNIAAYSALEQQGITFVQPATDATNPSWAEIAEKARTITETNDYYSAELVARIGALLKAYRSRQAQAE